MGYIRNDNGFYTAVSSMILLVLFLYVYQLNIPGWGRRYTPFIHISVLSSYVLQFVYLLIACISPRFIHEGPIGLKMIPGLLAIPVGFASAFLLDPSSRDGLQFLLVVIVQELVISIQFLGIATARRPGGDGSPTACPT